MQKATTWRELRDLLNQTEDRFLDKPLEWHSSEESDKGEVSIIQETYYQTEGDDCMTWAEYILFHGEPPTEPPVAEKGQLSFDTLR